MPGGNTGESGAGRNRVSEIWKSGTIAKNRIKKEFVSRPVIRIFPFTSETGRTAALSGKTDRPAV